MFSTRSGVRSRSASRSVTSRSSLSIGIERPLQADVPCRAQVAQA